MKGAFRESWTSDSHEVFNDSVERAALVAEALLASRELPEVVDLTRVRSKVSARTPLVWNDLRPRGDHSP